MLTPLPQGLSLEDQGFAVRIIRKWFSVVHIFTFLFSLFWNGFLFFWYSIALSGLFDAGADTSADAFSNASIIFLAFPLIHVAVGVGLFYFSLAGFLNKTILELNSGMLSITHTPLPWRGNLKLSTAEIKQLYCKEKITHSRNGTSVNYSVNIILQNDKSIALLKGLPEKDQATYIEHLVEEKLQIKNTAVAGEIGL